VSIQKSKCSVLLQIKIPFRSSNVEGLLLSGGAVVSIFTLFVRAIHYSYDKGAGWNKNMISLVLVWWMDGRWNPRSEWNKNMIFLVLMSGRWNGWKMKSMTQME
jgi:hypothetical protein